MRARVKSDRRVLDVTGLVDRRPFRGINNMVGTGNHTMDLVKKGRVRPTQGVFRLLYGRYDLILTVLLVIRMICGFYTGRYRRSGRSVADLLRIIYKTYNLKVPYIL